jgi:hypothetical protein
MNFFVFDPKEIFLIGLTPPDIIVSMWYHMNCQMLVLIFPLILSQIEIAVGLIPFVSFFD